MKRNLLLILVLQVIIVNSCKKDSSRYVMDNYILAGQKAGAGIEYIDLDPDIHCTIVNPWETTDTVINLDLDRDGINDFRLIGSVCPPSMLGAECAQVTMDCKGKNEICSFRTSTDILDTLLYLDSINANRKWTNGGTIAYSFYADMSGYSSTTGYWQQALTAGKYYIGCKLIKDGKQRFGWIGMRNDPDSGLFDFVISDYALVKEYEE